MPQRRRNKLLTSLESVLDAGTRQLGRSIRAAVAESGGAVAAEMKELRKALIRLQRTMAQVAGMSPAGGRRRPMKLCLVEGCGRKHAAKGLCKNHYQQWLNRKRKEGPRAPKPGGVPIRMPVGRRGRPRKGRA
jgi:hypothetical protein